MESETMASSHIREQTDCGQTMWSLYQPDTLLLQRYVDERCGKTGLEPEKRLMLAILEDALQCFQDNCAARQGKKKQLFDNVQKWFGEVGSDWVFGFENICSVLGFSPEYVRAGLMRLREKELSQCRSTPRWTSTHKLRSSAPRLGAAPAKCDGNFAGLQRR